MIILQYLLAMAVLLCFSAFFSASETALFSLSRRDLHQLEHTPSFVHGLIVRLRSDPQSLLMTVLFGNMLVNVLYYSMATLASLHAAAAHLHTASYTLGVGSLIVLIICGEVGPKAVAVSIPLRFSHLAAVPLFFFQRAIYPVRKVLAGVLRVSGAMTRGRGRAARVTPEELQLLVRATGARGVIAHSERDMMHDIIEFAQIRVHEVMVPRVDVVVFDISGSVREFRKLIEKRRATKVPVYDRNTDNIVGIVYSRDVLLSGCDDVRSCVRPVPLFVPDTARIEPVLHQFRERKCQFAVVVDEYGGWAGIVTLEDIIEEIVGDISDEFDTAQEPVRKLSLDRYVLSGGVSARNWSRIFGIDVGNTDVKTLGGFIMFELGRLPREGDTVKLGNLVFTVQKVSGRRVAEVQVERVNGEGPAGEEGGP